MGAGVVTVGRRLYAAGLYWENSPSSRVVAAAKEAASQPGQQADFFAVRAGKKDGHVPQFGLGQAVAGHKAGMPAFAGCLANQQPGSWIGAFRLREGIAVTVVRDELIVPDGDQFFIDENEARERLLQEISFGGLQKIYAPESWSIPGADNMPIGLLLDERRDVRLRMVQTPKIVWVSAGIVFMLLVVGLGVGWYIQNQAAQQEQQRLDALARAKAEAEKLLPTNGEPHYPPPERKWEQRPLPLDVINACKAGLTQIPAAEAGWHMNSVHCDGTAMTINWSRDRGISVTPPGWTITPNVSSATSTVTLAKLDIRGHEDLLNPDEITKRYLAQDWPGSLNRAPDDPPPQPPPGYKGTWNPPPAPWVKRSFTLAVPELPASLPKYFSDLPGTVVNSMAFAPSGNEGGSWSVEGVIYENR